MKLLQARPAEGDPSLLLKESSLCAGGASITSPLYLYYQLNAQYCRNLCVSLAGDDLDIRSQELENPGPEGLGAISPPRHQVQEPRLQFSGRSYAVMD